MRPPCTSNCRLRIHVLCWLIALLKQCTARETRSSGPSVTGGHDWEKFLTNVIVWRSAWPSRCDIPGTAPYRNGTILRCVPQFIPRNFTLLERWSNDLDVDVQDFCCSFQPDSCVQQVVEVNDTFHLVVNHLRLLSAGRWNEGLRHESEHTVTDLSGIPVTGQLSCQLLRIVCSPPTCPATTLGMMTLPLTH